MKIHLREFVIKLDSRSVMVSFSRVVEALKKDMFKLRPRDHTLKQAC